MSSVIGAARLDHLPTLCFRNYANLSRLSGGTTGLQLHGGVLCFAIPGPGMGNARQERDEEGDSQARSTRAVVRSIQRCRYYRVQHRPLVDSR